VGVELTVRQEDFGLEDLPFYAGRTGSDGRVQPWDLDDLTGGADGDPYAGRVRPGTRPAVSLQVEASYERSVWVGAQGDELQRWSFVLEAMLRRWGLEQGELLAFFEYGSSPVVLLASRCYLPHLREGAADRIGCSVVCNDGVASMAPRMVEVVRLARPAGLFVRADVAAPFTDALADAGVELGAVCRWAALLDVDGAPRAAERDRWREAWQLPVHRVARADAGFFLAGECASCGWFHVDTGAYELEPLVGGDVAVTARFARICPAVRLNLGPGAIHEPGCGAEPEPWRLEWR
jgi:hypothetical protein